MRELPQFERAARRAYDPAFEARLERLKAARNRLAIELDLAPGVLCPNGTLEAIARTNATTVAALSALPELRQWQLREIGEQLLVAAREPASVSGSGTG